MKLTVIGYWGGYPAPGEATSTYVIEKDSYVLVLDMGSGGLAQLQEYYSINAINAVLLSHYHHDHVADIGVLQYAKLVQYYITGKEDLIPIYGHMEDEEAFARLTADYTEGVSFDPNELLIVGPFTVTFLKTDHPVPCYGMRITDGDHSFVYTADSAYDPKWIDFVQGADMLLVDCNFYADQNGKEAGHMTSVEAATIAAKANVSELILTHLPRYGDQEQLVEEAKEHFKGEIKLAYEGLTWEIKS